MAKKRYSKLEEHIIQIFQKERLFAFHGKMYDVMNVGKPRPQGSGECKTDVFVRAKEQVSGDIEDIKISVKTEKDQEFQENKVSMDRAEAFFGKDWEVIISNATKSLKGSFESRPLLYASGHHPTKPNSVTVGWKLEIACKPRALSVKAPLTDREIRDYVYKGTNQTEVKRNAIVNGVIIDNSGVAEYLLITTIEKIRNVTDVISQMELIDTKKLDDTYLIFTANNYRTDVDKADGKRSLAVRIEWECNNQKLTPIFHYDQPLHYTGEGDMRPLVKDALETLGKKNVNEINPRVDLISADIFEA